MSNYNSTLQSNNTDLQAILNTINELPEAGGPDPVLQEKTVTPTTNSQTVTPDSGYDGLNKVTVNAIPTATQATPSISVDSAGKITATATQTAGYVAAGTKSATKQLTVQAAQTITPGTTNKTIASGTYLTGTQTIKGDANLIAANIKSGVSIFGVTGTASGGSSGGTDVEDAIITKTIGSYSNDRVKNIGDCAFYSCSRLTTVSFPVATTIGASAFYTCNSLTTVSFPAATTISNGAFGYCSRLTTVNFPVATMIGASAFYDCTSLTTVSFPAATTIGYSAFYNCNSLTTVSFPVATRISNGAFRYCHSLTTVNFPVATTIGASAFYTCNSLTTVSFPAATRISGSAFYGCTRLSRMYLLGSSVCKLSASNALSQTPFAGNSNYFSGTPYIYVPSALLTSYKTATNWTYFSKYMRAY